MLIESESLYHCSSEVSLTGPVKKRIILQFCLFSLQIQRRDEVEHAVLDFAEILCINVHIGLRLISINLLVKLI